jgi:hypothetical protein
LKKIVKPAVVINIAVYLTAISLLVYFTRLIMNADYFKVKDIICREANPADFYYLAGKNIFSLNLNKESARFSAYYPHYKKVRLVRIIPNQIYIDFLKRVPIAYVKLYRDFCVDEDLFLFELPGSGVVLDIPVIYGLDKKFSTVKPGKRFNTPELEAAVEIIKEIRANKALDNFNIKRIDLRSRTDAVILGSLASPGNSGALFFLEIRIPLDNIRPKIGILTSLFSQDKDNLRKIKYIDLRFKEPVVKFKNAA